MAAAGADSSSHGRGSQRLAARGVGDLIERTPDVRDPGESRRPRCGNLPHADVIDALAS
jgi:hypothetical protein